MRKDYRARLSFVGQPGDRYTELSPCVAGACKQTMTTKSREKENKSSSNQPLVCVDLFAGAGGFSLAAMQAGFTIAAAVELNAHACKTYKKNIADSYGVSLYEGDILNVCPESMKKLDIGEHQECDVLLGGPPCQGFSVHRINDAGVDDPRNKLIFKYFEFVKTIRPKVFLMENVPGMLWARHRPFLDAFYLQAKAANYKVLQPIEIDARDYGVPQRRKRVFILGIRNDVDLDIQWPPRPTHGDSKTLEQDETLLPWLIAQTVFQMDDMADDINNIHMNHSQELIDVFKATPKNGGSRHQSGRVLKCHQGHDGHKDVYGRIDLLKPGPTMTTACINPSKGRFVHPTEDHGITVRQAARFQTFPDSFQFEGGLIASGVQVGNAVPVKLGQVLLESIKKGLTVDPKKNTKRG